MEKFSPLYLKMCEKGKRIFGRLVQKNYWFYHPILNDEEVKERQVEKILGSDVLTSDSIEHYPLHECIWLPTVKEIKKMAEDIEVYEAELEKFLNDDKGYWGYPIGMKPRNIFKTLKEQWLAYYMAEKSQIWSEKNEDWVNIKSL